LVDGLNQFCTNQKDAIFAFCNLSWNFLHCIGSCFSELILQR